MMIKEEKGPKTKIGNIDKKISQTRRKAKHKNDISVDIRVGCPTRQTANSDPSELT